MTSAYDELYLRNARSSLANSLDYAVYSLGYDLEEYYHMFLRCDLTDRFEKGDPFLVSGHSGVELALMVVEKNTGKFEVKERIYHDGKSREYWCGWAIAYYQWYSACSLRQLEKETPITSIYRMYDKYHEMDIMHFVERVDDMRQEKRVVTYLKLMREAIGLSQSELSRRSGIPLKTLQHYEQGTKSLAKANASYVLGLARILGCEPRRLIS